MVQLFQINRITMYMTVDRAFSLLNILLICYSLLVIFLFYIISSAKMRLSIKSLWDIV